MTTLDPNPEDLEILLKAFSNYSDKPLSNEALQVIERVGMQGLHKNGTTFLMLAAGCNHFDNIHFLLDKGVSVVEADWRGSTALHHAFNDEPIADCVQILIDAGACLEARDVSEMTPLIYGLYRAAEPEQDADALMALIESGADLDATIGAEGLEEWFELGKSAREIILDPSYGYPERLVDCVRRVVALRSQTDLKDKLLSVENSKSKPLMRVM